MMFIQTLSLLLCALFIFRVDGLTSLTFQKDGLVDSTSLNFYTLYNGGPIKSMTSLTICTWFKLIFQREVMALWSHCASFNSSLAICTEFVFEKGAFVFKVSEQFIEVNSTGKLKPGWNHACVTAAFSASQVVLNGFLNGVSLQNGTFPLVSGVTNFAGGGQLVLGQRLDSLTLGYELEESYSGILTQFHIWDSIVANADIANMANCQGSLVGTVVDWNTASWNVTNFVITDTVAASDLCIPYPNKTYMIFPERRDIDSAFELCQQMGGKVAIPFNSKENLALTQLAKSYADDCQRNLLNGKTVWIGASPTSLTGVWSDMTSLSNLSYTNWRPGYGLNDENCAYLLTGNSNVDGKWSNAICTASSSRHLCTACEFATNGAPLTYYLRGLCVESKQDRTYTLEIDSNNKPYFKGTTTSIIFWDATVSAWHLVNLEYSAEAILPDSTGLLYPIGRNMWNFTNSPCTPDSVPMQLSLSTCQQDTQLTCNDGTCLPISHRCDIKGDCLDRADEQNCNRMIMPSDYDFTQPPKNTVNGKRSLTPIPVTFNIEVTNFDKIDTYNMMLSMVLKINMSWYDRRMTFLNLKSDIYQNLLSPNDQDTIWMPIFAFDNAVTGTVVYDEFRLNYITNFGLPKPFDPSRSQEDVLYNGYENPIVLIRRYYASYHCTFDMTYFPFDRQNCTLAFKMRTATTKFVQLFPKTLTYVGPVNMVEFTLTNYSASVDPTSSRTLINVFLILDRRYGYYLVNAFLQTLALTFLGYSCFFIDIEDFTDRFMGHLTLLVVLAALLVTLTANLPPTSYLKLLDIWLLFFLLINAVFTGLDCWIDFEYRKETIERKKAILEKSDLSKSDLAALGQEKPQICWEQESGLLNAEPVKGKEIPELEIINEDDTKLVDEKEMVEPKAVDDGNENVKEEDATTSKPEESDGQTSGTSALIFAAFYEDWASKTGKAERINKMVKIVVPVVVIIFVVVFFIVAAIGSSAAANH